MNNAYLVIAEDFAKIIWPHKRFFKLDDILLYGSVAKGKENPLDIDLLIIHHSDLLNQFQSFFNSKNLEDIQKLIIFSRVLREESEKRNLIKKLFYKAPNLIELLDRTDIQRMIYKDKFNTKYLDTRIIKDKIRINDWKAENSTKNGDFLNDIFSYGKLWNPKSEKYDIPGNQKYFFD